MCQPDKQRKRGLCGKLYRFVAASLLKIPSECPARTRKVGLQMQSYTPRTDRIQRCSVLRQPMLTGRRFGQLHGASRAVYLICQGVVTNTVAYDERPEDACASPHPEAAPLGRQSTYRCEQLSPLYLPALESLPLQNLVLPRATGSLTLLRTRIRQRQPTSQPRKFTAEPRILDLLGLRPASFFRLHGGAAAAGGIVPHGSCRY